MSIERSVSICLWFQLSGSTAKQHTMSPSICSCLVFLLFSFLIFLPLLSTSFAAVGPQQRSPCPRLQPESKYWAEHSPFIFRPSRENTGVVCVCVYIYIYIYILTDACVSTHTHLGSNTIRYFKFVVANTRFIQGKKTCSKRFNCTDVLILNSYSPVSNYKSLWYFGTSILLCI
jgi:hypothetical protein